MRGPRAQKKGGLAARGGHRGLPTRHTDCSLGKAEGWECPRPETMKSVAWSHGARQTPGRGHAGAGGQASRCQTDPQDKPHMEDRKRLCLERKKGLCLSRATRRAPLTCPAHLQGLQNRLPELPPPLRTCSVLSSGLAAKERHGFYRDLCGGSPEAPKVQQPETHKATGPKLGRLERALRTWQSRHTSFARALTTGRCLTRLPAAGEAARRTQQHKTKLRVSH